jgi:hypothetical protein
MLHALVCREGKKEQDSVCLKGFGGKESPEEKSQQKTDGGTKMIEQMLVKSGQKCTGAMSASRQQSAVRERRHRRSRGVSQLVFVANILAGARCRQCKHKVSRTDKAWPHL